MFLIGFGKEFQPMITLTEYSSLFLTIYVGLGVIFEMPIVIFFLALMGMVSAGWMWRNIRYAILGIFVVAAIITPTPDILNMCIFAAPGVCILIGGTSARRKNPSYGSDGRATGKHGTTHKQNRSSLSRRLCIRAFPVVQNLAGSGHGRRLDEHSSLRQRDFRRRQRGAKIRIFIRICGGDVFSSRTCRFRQRPTSPH